MPGLVASSRWVDVRGAAAAPRGLAAGEGQPGSGLQPGPGAGQRWLKKYPTRSPSSALLPVFGGEGSPTKIDYRKQLVPLF